MKAKAVTVPARKEQQDWVDYSARLRLSSSPLKRGIYAGLGFVCVALAVIGAILPGLPTTIWLIVAAFLFSRSSPRFYNAIMNHRFFGPVIRDYQAGNGIPLRVKLIAISCIVIFAGASTVFLISNEYARMAVIGVAMFGIGFLAAVKTRPPYEASLN